MFQAGVHEGPVFDIKYSISDKQIFSPHLANTRLSDRSGEPKWKTKNCYFMIWPQRTGGSTTREQVQQAAGGKIMTGSGKAPARDIIRALNEFSGWGKNSFLVQGIACARTQRLETRGSFFFWGCILGTKALLWALHNTPGSFNCPLIDIGTQNIKT